MIQYLIVNKDNFNEMDFSEISRIHYKSLSYRSVLTLYGEHFLTEIYKIIVEKQIGFLVIAKDEHIFGFACAITDNSRLMKTLLLSLNKLIFKMITAIIKRPLLLFKTLEMFKYSSNAKETKCELLSIAIEEEYRGNKIGSKLLLYLEKEFKKLHINKYQVTVHTEMINSNNFYKQNNMRLSNTFNMLNTQWNLWVKKI